MASQCFPLFTIRGNYIFALCVIAHCLNCFVYLNYMYADWNAEN